MQCQWPVISEDGGLIGGVTATVLKLTQKPVQFDHVQLEVMNETIDIEEMAHQSHQAVAYNTHRNE